MEIFSQLNIFVHRLIVPNAEVQHLESATSIPSEYTTFEPELDIVQVPLAV